MNLNRVNAGGVNAIKYRIDEIEAKLREVSPPTPQRDFQQEYREAIEWDKGGNGMRPMNPMSGEIGVRFAGGPFEIMAREAARKEGVDEDIFLSLVSRESNWDPAAVSKKGALGLTQLMPGTAADLGVDPKNPTQNLAGGAKYLRQMMDRFGQYPLALAAYNAGPSKVEKFNGIPPIAETQKYVNDIMAMSSSMKGTRP